MPIHVILDTIITGFQCNIYLSLFGVWLAEICLVTKNRNNGMAVNALIDEYIFYHIYHTICPVDWRIDLKTIAGLLDNN